MLLFGSKAAYKQQQNNKLKLRGKLQPFLCSPNIIYLQLQRIYETRVKEETEQ